MTSNSLYYGDNLDILRRYIQNESVDLVYLDPPFKSNQTYNVLFQEKDGSQSASQIKAFADTWHWDETSVRSYEDTVEAGGQAAEAMQAEIEAGHTPLGSASIELQDDGSLLISWVAQADFSRHELRIPST